MGFILNMKRALAIISFVAISIGSNAQVNPAAVAAKVAAPARVFTTVTPSSYESSLAYGKLTLLKTLTRPATGTEYTISYSLVGFESNADFNNGKPLAVKLSKDFYTGTFLNSYREIAAKTAVLNSYVQLKNLTLNTEKEWAHLINYYNGL